MNVTDIVLNGKRVGISGGGDGGDSLDVYSTEETRIGTWIDGKPLYRRVWSIVSAKSGGWRYACTVNDLDQLVGLKGILYAKNGTINVAPYADGTTIFCINYSKTENSTFRIGANYIFTATSFEDCPLVIIVEYTKATDQPETPT